MNNKCEVNVSVNNKGERIDRFLALEFPDLSRSYFQYLITKQSIQINGSYPKKRTLVQDGDVIKVAFLNDPEITLTPEKMPLDILYEDEHLLAVNKPAHLVVHPGAGNREHTLVNGLLYYLKDLPETDHPHRPGIVHRLDKETSGVILIAKTRSFHLKLSDLFFQRKMEKTYLAICHNTPPEGLVESPIARHPIHRKQMTIDIHSGKPAQTDIEILSSHGGYSFLSLRPKTGRTHQIRVHLKHLNSPVVGDKVYGPKNTIVSFRHLLHARKISFIHPVIQQPISIQAPLPEDFSSFIEKYDLFS